MIKKLNFLVQCLHGILYYATVVLPLLAGCSMALSAAAEHKKRSKI